MLEKAGEAFHFVKLVPKGLVTSANGVEFEWRVITKVILSNFGIAHRK
jgi:hypothetical protein